MANIVEITPPDTVTVRVEEAPTSVVVTAAQGPAGATGPAGAPGVSRVIKTGVVPGASFAGTPKKFAVVFVTPYGASTYSVALSGTDSRSYTYESKTTTGFTINANANTAIAGEVSWSTTVSGET